MAMTKAEKQKLEEALTLAALRFTGKPPAKDIAPPEGGKMTSGYFFNIFTQNVRQAHSKSYAHTFSNPNRDTWSREPIWLYSTKLMALQALRHATEMECAGKLRAIDVMIEKEEATHD